MSKTSTLKECSEIFGLKPKGLLRELNPGPLAPEARIIPLDQAAGDHQRAATLAGTAVLRRKATAIRNNRSRAAKNKSPSDAQDCTFNCSSR